MFGNKNDNTKNNTSGDDKKVKKSNVSLKRKNKGHALTFSVPEAATEVMRDNAPFIVNGKTVCAATSVRSAIGDLSDKKDSDIGQIVNYINHGTIAAVVLEPLLEDDTIIIIPDSATIDTMRAYDSFKNAEYELCYVDLESGEIKQCFNDEVKVPFSDLENIVNGREKLITKLGITKPSPSAPSDFDEDDDFRDPLYSETADVFGDDEFDLPDDEFDSEPDNSFDGADYTAQESKPTYQNYQAQEKEYVEPEPEDPFEETTEETIFQTAMRTFMIDDIQLDVSDEPFTNQFNANDLVRFTENRPIREGDGISNHLNECLNNMSKAANEEVKQMRLRHISALHSSYFNALSEFVKTSINSALSTIGNTAAAIDRKKIEDTHIKDVNNLESEVNTRKSNIDREFNESIINVRNAAAEAAEHEYRENHQKQYIAQIDAIRNVVEQEIENKYVNNITKQNDTRHTYAVEMLDDAIGSILEQLTVQYADMVTTERNVYQKHMESMLEFMSHQRYNEMNRIRVLQDEHARVDIAEKMSAKHAADVANITAKFNAQKKSLDCDIESMRKNLDVAVNRAVADAERQISSLRMENQKLAENVERAQSKLETADERAQAKYVNEIESLHNQVSRWEDESNKLHNGQKTSIFIMLGLAVAAVIAAISIGYISGQANQAKQYSTAIQVESPVNNTSDATNNSDTNATKQETNESDAEFSNSID